MNSQVDVSYDEAIQKLYSLEYTGMKLGLDNIKALTHFFGDPHKAFPTIHVAGTNGKGSVCNMLAAALQANGYKVGLYTSPHLVNYTERMKIDGKEISRERLVHYFQDIWEEIERIKATFFEATTAIAFQYFKEEAVDVAVIETGLGGRLDATNVLEKPLATVITSIGLEHTEILGDTLEKIAYEKACIFKPGVPAIVSAPEETHRVFIAKAGKVGAPLHFVRALTETPDYLSLQGEHQRDNLAIVLECLRHLPLQLDEKKTEEGIKNTYQLTGLRARLEEYRYKSAEGKGVKLILDVAHNPHGLERVKEYFLNKNIRPVVIAGFAKDKDIDAALTIINSFASQVIGVSANMPRSLSVEELAELAKKQGVDMKIYPVIAEAVNTVISMSKTDQTVLLTGSHYVVGEFLNDCTNEHLT